MSPELRRYLDLEQAMLELDAHGNPEADMVRDIMDAAWRELGAADRTWVNARELPPLHVEVRLAVGNSIHMPPPRPSPSNGQNWTFLDWRVA